MYALMQRMITIKQEAPAHDVDKLKSQVDLLDELRVCRGFEFETTLKNLIRPTHTECLHRLIHAYPESHSLRRMYLYSKFYDKACDIAIGV